MLPLRPVGWFEDVSEVGHLLVGLLCTIFETVSVVGAELILKFMLYGGREEVTLTELLRLLDARIVLLQLVVETVMNDNVTI